MAKSLIGALALASLPSALAFRNTSPYFLFSTAALDIPGDDVEIAKTTTANDRITQALAACPSKTYFIVRQEGVSSADFVDTKSAPRLASYLGGKDADIKSSMIVPEVLGDTAPKSFSEHLQRHCSATLAIAPGGQLAPDQKLDAEVKVIEVSFPAPSSRRVSELAQNDADLETLIADLAHAEDYTVIYTSTPPTEAQAKAALESQHAYEMEDSFNDAVHMELKRDLSSHTRAAVQEGGLFEKYQFFSPAIFMGIGAIIPLFSIVFVGLKALSSLEVSYFAFSKEMGPAQQRK